MGIKSTLKFNKSKALSIESGINNLTTRYPDLRSSCLSEPVFILSAGWRSGSTLLQRLLMSSEQIIIWGEPYGHSGMIDNLASSLKAITSDYPNSSWFINIMLDERKPLSTLSNEWIANLYPEVTALLNAHVAFFKQLFEAPAISRGVYRWGIKEVRLTIDHAIYLSWLFPKAKFLFLYRNPYDSYVSYRGFYWYKQYPNDPICTPQKFGNHWKELVEGFIKDFSKVNGLLLRYEDLCSEAFSLQELEDFLHLKLDSKTLGNVLYSTKTDVLSDQEVKVLAESVNPLAFHLGYEYRG